MQSSSAVSSSPARGGGDSLQGECFTKLNMDRVRHGRVSDHSRYERR